MNWTPVESSNLTDVGQDPEIPGLLGIRFKGGGEYHYTGVPENMHDRLIASFSPGKLFYAEIKGKYPTEKIA